MAYTVTVEAPYKAVVAAVSSNLSRRGYHLVRSFDLQDAVASHAEGCDCPYHGTALCTCQYVVLLAYPPDRLPAPPRVFTIHAYEQMTWITLQPDRSIGAGETHVLHSALAEAATRPEAQEKPIPSCARSAVSVVGQ